MKMSGLCWMAVMLTFLLSAGNSFAVVDKKELANIVKFIIDRYEINSQVSVAVNIPQENANLQEIFKKATTDAVKRKLSSNQVYPGDNSDTKVVVAKPKFASQVKPYTDHAEALVLENIKPLVQDSNGKFLVFYSFYSPCGEKCTNKDNDFNIIGKINNVIPKWKNYAFVFSKVFDRTGEKVVIDKQQTIKSLKQLGNSKIGQNNIFRCYEPINKAFQCINCFDNGNVVEQCVDNNA
ncbi:uncharacterized protein LOC122979142 [Thunnus albacares]|uniref:uncharacterized protein LOC122979142 n=1 Tax=Thunnus albacares TaxID=8236 RepID=UPI001CF6D886|nr:uncharacterized protein LOC122979142 [Thunnus albacares]